MRRPDKPSDAATFSRGESFVQTQSKNTGWPEAIAETLTLPLLLLDADLRILVVNSAFLKFFGCGRERLIGASLLNLADSLTGETLTLVATKVRAALADQPQEFFLAHRLSAQDVRSLVVNVRKIPAQASQAAAVLVYFDDVTLFKSAKQSLYETQEQLKLALAGGAVGTWVWDITKQKVMVSRGDEMTGDYDQAQVRDYGDWEKEIHPDDLPGVRKAVMTSLEDGSRLDLEFRMIWPDGSVRWVLAKALPYYSKKGIAERMMGVHVDITDRRRAMEESERHFQVMSDYAPVMIWMAGAHAEMSFVNRAWLLFTGRGREEELGRGWQTLIHPEDVAKTLGIFRDAFDSRRDCIAEFRLKRSDNEYRWILSHGCVRRSGDGRFAGLLGTCIDITERMDLERLKDEFMGIASHELKTPVTSIKAYAQILRERFTKASDEMSAGMMARLDLQVDKLTGLINRLLDVAKIQSGQMDFVYEQIEVAPFIAEVVEEIQRTLPAHRIMTEVRGNNTIRGDRWRLSQVLTNLLSNAAKYSPDADRILVTVRQAGDSCMISVRDSGIGIPAVVREKIFDRFFKAGEEGGQRAGLGLGLYISSQIVEHHGGKLRVESTPGQGSEFSFSVPLFAPDP